MLSLKKGVVVSALVLLLKRMFPELIVKFVKLGSTFDSYTSYC
jgi:hypothetical protein